MNFALYIISAAISILRILYMTSKKPISSSLLVFTVVEGGSIRCVLYSWTYIVLVLSVKLDITQNRPQGKEITLPDCNTGTVLFHLGTKRYKI